VSGTSNVNLYLIAPSLDNPNVYEWDNIPVSEGSYNVTLMPRWWKSTPSVQLQFQMVPSGTPAWMSTLPSGPVFTATYTTPASGTPPSADTSISDSSTSTNVSQIVSGAASTSQLSKGKIAAAVIMPLLAIIFGTIVWLYFSRKKGFTKRKEWSENVDKRMSTISADWKSMSAAGANAAIRHSMAGNRNSFAFGAVRPVSAAASEGGQVGVGARGLYTHENSSISQMSQLRPGLRTSAFENRVSRVSFANDPRPSHEARRSQESRRSRALYTASTYDDVPDVPPLPAYDNFDAVGTMSPLQTSGAVSLSVDDIHTKVGDRKERNSTFDEVLPALSLMRTDGYENDEGSFYPDAPELPEAAHSKLTLSPDYFQTVTAPSTTIFSASPMSPNYPTSPVTTNQYGMAVQPLPANVMSPDDMLRAYAERNAAARVSGVATPSSRASHHHRPSSYSLGSGVGFGALNSNITYPDPTAGAGRSLIPAGPGSYSPSRGAYGVESVYEPKEAYNIGVAE